MADRYWRGGTAAWDGTAGTKWADTAGGAAGAAVPTSADDVYFDATSTGTCTISSGNTGAKSINCTGFTGTLAGSTNITVSGSVTLVAGMGFTYANTFIINGTGTITTAGKTIGGLSINGAGITVTLGDAVTISATLGVVNGTFDTANYNVTALTLSSSGSSGRTISLGSSTVTLSTGANAVDFTTNTNLTFNAGTSTIICTASGCTLGGGGISQNGVTFYNVSFTSTATGTYSILGINTFNNLTVTAPSSAGVRQVTFDSRQTINGTLSTTGTAGNRRVWFRSATYGIAQTLTVNATPSLTDADFRDLYVIGTAAPISGTRVGDLRGCRGITFSTPKTVYWNLAAGGNWSANAWAASSGAGVSTDNFPLAQDTAVIENTGLNTSATVTLDAPVPYFGTIDMSTRTNAMTLAGSTAYTVYGDWEFGSGVTRSYSGSLTFSGRNTQVITSAGKSFSQAVTVDSYGGTVELADALNTGGGGLIVTNGTFDTKNYNLTTTQLNSSGSTVREIVFGSSVLTMSNSTAIDFSTSTNLTFDAGTSTINHGHAGNPAFFGGGLTFYNLNYTSNNAAICSITGTNTFNNVTVASPSSAGFRQLTLAANQTITGTLTVAGATAVRRIFVRSDTLGTTRTLTVGTLSATDCDFRDITIAGTAAGSSPTRAGDCGGNSGITFPAAKTVYWNLAGAQNWSATAWAPGSGGSPDINNFPLAQDTAVFDEAAGSVTGTITINTAWNIGTFDASLRTSAMTLTTSTNTPFVYGDWKFGTGVTSSSTTGTITFAKRGTQTITSNGITFGCPITIDAITGIVQLADALSIGSTRTLTLTSGTFDAVSYNVTTGLFSQNTNIGTILKMGSGTWTLSGTGSVWNYQTTAPPTAFYKGTANIVLSDTSASARTFVGGGLSYNKLTIGGTTGTSTLTISGNNQFTELASTKTVAHTIALGSTAQTFGKWTVTGTVGNVVTLTGTGTAHILAGACTDSIDYLAMGSIGFAATSPGEFYAGANSTGTAAAPVYRTAKPADSTRYWVGGTGNWSDTARWSTGSGGVSGASVPRSHDDVVFDSLSNATAYTATVNAVTGGIRMKSLTIAGPASGNVTLAGSTAIDGIHGNVTLPATGLTRTYTGAITLSGSTSGLTLTTNGVALASTLTVNGVGCEWTLGSALDIGSSSFSITNGLFDCDVYNLSVSFLISAVNNSRTIDLGSSTVTVSGNGTTSGFGSTETQRANLTFIAGTSQINYTSSIPEITGNNQSFYNVAFTSTSAGTVTINGANSFNNLSFTGITSAGLKIISVTANQTITGTFTCSAGANATMRHFVRSNTLGATRTLTCAAVSLTDVDFRDITIAGAAAPATGTRLGDCKGNSGITFTAAANKYWNLAAGGNWGGAIGWATGSGGTPNINDFPLAQDTCFFEATGLNSGATITVNQDYNIGTIDMSARTTNTMTLATGSTTTFIYGNWINGTGTTLTGDLTMTFAGRGNQTITSAGRTFTQRLGVDSPNGSVTLQDAFLSSNSSTNAFIFTRGTFNANVYNVTLSGASSSVNTSGVTNRTIAIGSGTWSIAGSGAVWNATTSTNLTVTGTGTISLTSASAKTFAGGSVSYSGITLDQGGAGTLTISGNNTFANITNTYKATGATTINFGTTTQTVGNFTAAGEATRLLTLTGSSASSPCTLVHSGTGTAANVDYLIITGVRAY
jgi:fibronectin-binding autotransporter adhesin